MERTREHIAGPRFSTAVDLLVLVVLALAVHGALLEPGKFPYSDQSDLVSYAWPTKQLFYDALRNGPTLPFWRRDELSGNLALTQPQALYTYPFHLLYWILPPLRAAGPTFWLELLLAGCGAYALGAALGLSRKARLLMGVAQLTSFKLLVLVYAGWVPVMPAMSLLPWLLAALAWFVRRPAPGTLAALALAAGLAFEAGCIQPYYYATILLAPLVLAWGGLRMGRGGFASAGATWAGIAAAAVLGFALAAHLWIPVLLDLPLISRGSVDYRFFLSTKALVPSQLWMLLDPEALGTPRLGTYARIELWEDVVYFGWVPGILAIAAVVLARPRALVLYLAGGAAATVALGFDTPVLRAVYEHLPGFSLFRVPSRMLFVGSVFVIVLAGFGADALFTRLRPRARWLPVALAAVCMTVMVVEGAVRSRQYIDMRPVSDLEIDLPVAGALEVGGEPYRTATLFPLTYGWLHSLGIEVISGYEPYGYAHYRRYLGMLETGRAVPSWPGSQVEIRGIARFDMLDALNVRYLMAMRPLALPDGWSPAGRWRRHPAYHYFEGLFEAPMYLYQRADARRRVFLADHVVPVQDEAEALRALSRVDLRSTAVVRTADALEPTPGPGDAIERIEESRNRLSFTTRTGGERFAVVSEVWHPGWSARIDGEPVPLLRTDHALLGLVVPSGAHEVRLDFEPPGWKTGLAVSAGGLVVLCCVGAAALRGARLPTSWDGRRER